MTALHPVLAEKVAKLVGRLGSEHDGEVVATGRAIQRTLQRAGFDLHDLARALTAQPKQIIVYRDRAAAGPAPTGPDRAQLRDMARDCLASPDQLDSWEKNFVRSLKSIL